MPPALSTPRACLCTVSTSGSHKWPPIATGSFFAQVAVAVASDDPHHVCSLARPPPSPCPIAFTDFIFPCRAPCTDFRGWGGCGFSTRSTPTAAAASLHYLFWCRIDANLAAARIIFRRLSGAHARIWRALESRAGRTLGQMYWAGKVLHRQAHTGSAGSR